MKDTELNHRLNAYQAPEPSVLLKARILKAAASKDKIPPAQSSFSKRFMPIAASLIAICAVSFGLMQTQDPVEPDVTAWQEAALDLGFEDVYDWVEAEETSSQ